MAEVVNLPVVETINRSGKTRTDKFLIALGSILIIAAFIAPLVLTLTNPPQYKGEYSGRDEREDFFMNLEVGGNVEDASLFEPIYEFKRELDIHGITTIDSSTLCLGDSLRTRCMKDGRVDIVATWELSKFLKLLEPMADFNVMFEANILVLFKRYCAHYNVQYGDHEMFIKYLSMFRHDLLRMKEHNQNAKRTYTMGYYTWLSEDTCKLIPATDYGSLKNDHIFNHTPFLFEANAKDDPQRATLDWREGGYVSRMSGRDKSKTGWMLAAAAMYDTFIAIKEGRRTIHSAQQLWDCASDFDDAKGDLKTPLEYFRDKNLCLEAQYPFMGNKNGCLDHQCKEKSIVKSVVKIEHAKAEEQIKGGPFVTIFDASEDFFKEYKGGIYEKELGTGRRVTALVVGYGTDAKGNKYWIAQNTWTDDPNWGEDGYFRIEDGIAQKGKMFTNAYGLSASTSPVP